MTLRAKILISLAIASVLAVAASAWFINRFMLTHQRQYIEQRLTIVSMMTHASLRNLMTGNHANELREFVLKYGNSEPMAGVRLIRPDGTIALSADTTEIGQKFSLQQAQPVWNGSPHYYRSDRAGHKVMSSIAPVQRLASCTVCHLGSDPVISYLNVDVSAEEAEHGVEQMQTLMVGSSLFIIVIFVGTAFSVHFRFVKRRISQIAAGIAKLEEGRFKARIDIQSNDELGQVAEHINRLGDRLDNMRAELEKSHLSELERAERMASVGELAASIAHEIRNPVAGIASAVQVLSAELPPGDEREAIFEEMLRQTARVNRAVTDLLSYARPSMPELVPGTIEDPIKRALTLLEAQRNAAKVDLALDLWQGLPNVLLDTQQMQQVLVNLIMNSLQAMSGGGRLTVRTGEIGDQVYVEVSDTGPGIPREVLHDIFKPFFTTKHQGTGLGLSICRSIVESHNGVLRVASEPGEGATFRIILPVHKKEEL